MSTSHHCPCRSTHTHHEYFHHHNQPLAIAAAPPPIISCCCSSCSSCSSAHGNCGPVGLCAALCEYQPPLNQAQILSNHVRRRSCPSRSSNSSTELNIPASLQAGHDHTMQQECQYHHPEQQRDLYIRHQSAPVNVVPHSHWRSPRNCSSRAKGIHHQSPGSNFNDEEEEEEEEEEAATDEAEEGEERLPPHELLAREWAEATSCGGAAFSLCQGVGRTLKGRDLRRVRNAILKQTGFI